jgi:hypothetical protein
MKLTTMSYFGSVEYVTIATKDYGYAECEYCALSATVLLNCAIISERSETRKKCSQNFDMTMACC